MGKVLRTMLTMRREVETLNKGFDLQLFAMSKPEVPRIQSRLEVKNEANNESAKLYLYGSIRKKSWWDDDEDDFISAEKVRNLLGGLKGKKLKVHINSGGGDVFESVAICNLLKQHDAEVDIQIDALAASGASIIATAGKVFMYKNSMQMIHQASTGCWGNSTEIRKVADDLDKIDSAVNASYMGKFVGTEEELSQLINKETWLTAEECLAFGLCDEILDEKKEEDPAPDNNIKETLFNKYKKNISAKVNEVGEDKKPTLFNAFKKQILGGKE